MKKLLIILIACLFLVGCTEKKHDEQNEQSEPIEYSPPYYLYSNARLASYDSLINNKIDKQTLLYLDGNITEITDIEDDGTTFYICLFTSNNHEYIIILDISNLTTYENLNDDKLRIVAEYLELNTENNKPVLLLKAIFDYKDGKTYNSYLYTLILDERESEEIKKQKEEKKKKQEEEQKETNIRKNVKEAIDAYEDFIDEYCKFMKKYESTDDISSLLMDYYNYLTKLSEYEAKIDKLEDDLNDAELVYYTTVMLRCNEKILNCID